MTPFMGIVSLLAFFPLYFILCLILQMNFVDCGLWDELFPSMFTY